MRAFVHRPAPLGDIRQWQLEVKTLTGLIFPVHDEVYQVESVERGPVRPTDFLLGEKCLAIELDAMRNPHEADLSAWPSGVDLLAYGLLGADAFEDEL
ncbi:hypothetical protein [Rhizobium anhuiense]|uniref:hypothetical protein n=1 Tax=Rhizobium anhuiense TaxID=1184720 RepID=UPI0015CF0AAA|nr:hypothetical protein [Rhizobium anhuiense]